MKHIIVLCLAITAWLSGPSQADTLKVVATSTAMGALAREIGSDRLELKVLAPPDRDLHYLQARPDMIRALRSADLLLAVGAELEQGWLPAALGAASNPRIQPGQAGYFEAAAQVSLLETGATADRALGDVHPAGNPHVTLDPVRMVQVAGALAARLSELDSAHASVYRQRANAFAAKVNQQLPGWQARVTGTSGVLLYHRDALYLLDRLNIPLLGVIEPIAGVPPAANHLKQLVSDLAQHHGAIVYTRYQPDTAVRRLQEQLHWPVSRLPLDPPQDANGDAYLEHIDQWVKALTATTTP